MSTLFKNASKCVLKRNYSLPFYSYHPHKNPKNVTIWIYATIATIPVAGYISKMCVGKHHHELGEFGEEGPPAPQVNVNVNGKEFPWGDGQLNLLNTVFGDFIAKGRREMSERFGHGH